MSDLKYIINTEDNEGLSGSTRSSHPSSTAKTSDGNHPPTDADTDKPQPTSRGSLSRSSRSTTTAPPTAVIAGADKTSPSRSPLVERRSIDSTESMDPAHYGGYTDPSSPNMPPAGRSSTSSGRMTSAPGEGNVPVKLTPITRRVSRAKKGVPVHTCDKCKPAKTFTRAEHLRRHQLSHDPAKYRCNFHGCGKAFHRQDLLTRHMQRHEQEDRVGTDMTGPSSRQTSQAPGERHAPSGFLQAPMIPGNKLSIAEEIPTNTSYTGSVSPYSTSHRGSMSGQGPMSPASHSSPSPSAGPSHSQAGDGYVLSTHTHHATSIGMHSQSIDGTPFYGQSYNMEPRTSPYEYTSLEGLRHLTIPDNNLTGHHLSQESTWASSSASGSPYSASDGVMIRGYEESNADISNPDMLYIPHYSPQQGVYNHIPEYSAYPEETSYMDPFSVRSPTPPTVTLSAQPVENLVTLGPSVSEPPAILSRQKGPVALLGLYPGVAAPVTASVPSVAALTAIPRYLDVYWKRFDTLFPLIHRRSLETSSDPVLGCAMAALGSQFLQSKEDRTNSHILHTFASQEVGSRLQWTLPVMQTILLCEFYGRFRGSRVMIRPSESFQEIYSRVATSHASSSADHDTSLGTSPQGWDSWIVAESRRRLLSACFVLDVHASMYYELPISPHFPTATPSIPLTKNTQHLWAAQDSMAWERLFSSTSVQPESVSLADEEITADHVYTASPLDRAIYLALETRRFRRSPVSALGASTDLDLDSIVRMRDLFPGSAVANTYLALNHTPLRDLLSVSGDSWLFSHKVLAREDFQRHKASIKSWSDSVHAGAASTFAAQALLAFFDNNDNSTTTTTTTTTTILNSPRNSMERDRNEGDWNTSDISDHWALYVCALICWSVTHRAAKGAAVARGGEDPASAGVFSSTRGHPHAVSSEGEAKAWLKTVASRRRSPEATANRGGGGGGGNVRARREALGVVAMVRRRLESETAGGKSKLLVDAVRVLKTLEEDPNRARF